ncbi:MAG TPA: ABC transporter permease [Chloroflexota bacterium]
MATPAGRLDLAVESSPPRPAERLVAAPARPGVLADLRQHHLGLAALGIVVVIATGSIFAPVIAPYDPMEMHSDYVLSPPGPLFWLGTDDFGRDILSRIMFGGRISLLVGLSAVLIGVSLGTLIGLISGYKGGAVDTGVQRLMDAVMAFPTLVLALALVAMLGISIQNIITAIAIVLIPTSARVVRSAVLAMKHETFLEAARVSGCTDLRIIARHVLPNVFGVVMVLATANLGAAIVTEAALSFVGLGTPPPTPSWGQMMTGAARTYIVTAPWMAFFPGLTLSLLVLGVNLCGDALRDALDPWLRKEHANAG